MKSIIRQFLWCGLWIIFGVSCTSVNTLAPTVAPGNSTDEWTSWLAQPVCKPPCWQNITPGVTTMKEAVSIVEKIPGTAITYNGQYGLSWNFGTKEEGGDITPSEEGKVNLIWLGSTSGRKLFVEMVVASYGDPEYVKPYDCREGMCETVLIYPDFGMLLDIFIKNKGTISKPQIEISPDTIVNRVYFIEQGIENFQKIPDFQDYDLLMKWKGYSEYP